MLIADSNGKITISLGGRCTLGCRHCYTNTCGFVPQPIKSPVEAFEELQRYSNVVSGRISVICISGDIDCFLNPNNGITLLELVIENFKEETIMFTTRLVLSNSNIDRIKRLWRICSSRQQLLIPCISLITFTFPNDVENPSCVPTSIDRLIFLKKLASVGMICFLTLRPTFPFSIVSLEEIRQILEYIGSFTAAVLGEVFLLDENSEIETKLSIDKSIADTIESSRMTFIDQPAVWHKIYLRREHDEIKKLCHEYGLPYFLRSVSAVNYIKHINTFRFGWKHDHSLFDTEIGSIYP